MNNGSEAIPFQAPEDAPQWFLDNIRQSAKSIVTPVAGHQVHMLAWNWHKTDLPVLFLVHGFTGNAYWWSFTAPFFMENYRVVAMDLPGMGDSDALERYDDDCFATAIVSCIEQHQLQPVCIAGHSFGGAQSIRAMAMAPDLFSHGIIVDTNVSLPPDAPTPTLEARSSHKLRETQQACLARFRLMPPQTGNIEAAVQYVAYHSCRQEGNGWRWKFDPGIQNKGEINEVGILCSVNTKVDLIYGEDSLFNTRNKPARLLENFPNGGELIVIPNACHHIMMDHPLELVAAIKKILNKTIRLSD